MLQTQGTYGGISPPVASSPTTNSVESTSTGTSPSSRFTVSSSQATLRAENGTAGRATYLAKWKCSDDQAGGVLLPVPVSNSVSTHQEDETNLAPGAGPISSLYNRPDSVDPGLNQGPSPLVAAELVNHDEEQRRIEQEVESRLMQRGGHRLVVTEVVNPANNPINGPFTSGGTVSCGQRFWKWKFLLLFILLCACGALVGVIISAQSSATTSFSTVIPTPSPTIAASPTTSPIATSSPSSGQSLAPSQFVESQTLTLCKVQHKAQQPTTKQGNQE